MEKKNANTFPIFTKTIAIQVKSNLEMLNSVALRENFQLLCDGVVEWKFRTLQNVLQYLYAG